MNKKLAVVVMSILNLFPIILSVVFFRKGANTDFFLIVSTPIIIIIHFFLSKNLKQLCIMEFVLILSTVIGTLANSALYFKFITYDSEGVLVMELMIVFAIGVIGVFSGISIIIKRIWIKQKVAKNNIITN